ncbi:hypothetical protein BSZ18_13050 [Bradyrhizobium canariense]|uniref:DUF488 domain-containing protein n=2 Tax=Nitrobacteraceae TaxID=41294 RepID=A0A1X3GJG4_9BRAD|nr:hypothetical protein BSZ25_20375 [Bradyrhizobium canariense]OSI91014.1 hypothetical protein BSZ24_18830 [Bradyrhizobium canariense]OSJ03974.1 hypothetical protein BSZ16_14810 [Bradyrhizobium canariense]OSJ12448.1 hypothetical protein BSZ18_13050 [Bradyrhizobium canariense]
MSLSKVSSLSVPARRERMKKRPTCFPSTAAGSRARSSARVVPYGCAEHGSASEEGCLALRLSVPTAKRWGLSLRREGRRGPYIPKVDLNRAWRQICRSGAISSDEAVTKCNHFLEILDRVEQTTVMAMYLQTFGYEGLTIQAFIERLKASGTRTVVDVRANPLSRKHGFSKKSFSAYLEKAGILYVHAAGVGCPKPVRDRYKVDGDWSAYSVGFLAHLKGRREDVADIVSIAKQGRACLVCFEADFERCHRKFVAEAAAAVGGFTVVHLTGQKAMAGPSVRSAA